MLRRMNKRYVEVMIGVLVMVCMLMLSNAAPATAASVDPQASEYTQSLFSYLQGVRGQKTLYGNQYATDYGVTITTPYNPAGTESDVETVVGDYPAVFGFDTLTLEGKARPGLSTNTSAQNVAALIAKMKQAHDLGGIITLSSHASNFKTGGTAYDNSVPVVPDLLPGGTLNGALNSYLDLIADVANGLTDNEGKKIPIILRMWHEQNGGWFWWGVNTTTTAQYIALYQYTVDYLRVTKGVHNFLYAWSPIAGEHVGAPFNGNSAPYLVTYPGDGYVDILGYDKYDTKTNPGTTTWLNALVTDMAMINVLADQKGKVPALTEFGVSLYQTGNLDLNWFTKVLNALKTNTNAKRLSYMLSWGNLGYPDNIFVPYKGSAQYGDHELAANFVNFYNDPYTVFASGTAGGVYTPAIIDNFEGYLGSNATLQSKYINSPAGGPLTVTLDTVNKNSGTYGMKYAYTLNATGYSGATKQLGSRDWSSFTNLQFWLKPDGLNQKLVIQLNLAGSKFEAYPSLAGTTPQLVTIPFSQFVPVWGATGVIDQARLKDAKEFSIFVNAMGGAQLSSTLYFDDIKVISNVNVKDWNFNTAGDFEGWGSFYQASATVSGGSLNLTTSGTDPQTYSPDSLAITAPTTYNKIRIRMQNNTSQTTGRVFFITNSDTTWNAAKSKAFTITANSGYTDYVVDMSTVAGWTGTIKRMRLDPLDPAGGSGQTVNIDYIRVSN